MSRRHDDRPIKRRMASREQKYRIVVVCEGKKTEPDYLRDFQHHVRNVRVHLKPVGPAGVPLSVVETAIEVQQAANDEARKQHDDNLRWDQVWAMFDVDDHPNVAAAKQLAVSHGIQLAVSNPCFELWALLHFANHTRHIHRDKLRGELQRHLPGYDKALAFARMHPGYTEAVRRAEQLDAAAARADRVGDNPTTGVYVLTEIIRTR